MRLILSSLLCSLLVASPAAFAKDAKKAKPAAAAKAKAKPAPKAPAKEAGMCMDKEDPTKEQTADGEQITTKAKCDADGGKWVAAGAAPKAGSSGICKDPASNGQAKMTPEGELITEKKACEAAGGVWQ